MIVSGKLCCVSLPCCCIVVALHLWKDCSNEDWIVFGSLWLTTCGIPLIRTPYNEGTLISRAPFIAHKYWIQPVKSGHLTNQDSSLIRTLYSVPRVSGSFTVYPTAAIAGTQVQYHAFALCISFYLATVVFAYTLLKIVWGKVSAVLSTIQGLSAQTSDLLCRVWIRGLRNKSVAIHVHVHVIHSKISLCLCTHQDIIQRTADVHPDYKNLQTALEAMVSLLVTFRQPNIICMRRRVTVVVLSVCLLSHISPLESENTVTYSTGNGGQKFVGFSLKPLRCGDPAHLRWKPYVRSAIFLRKACMRIIVLMVLRAMNNHAEGSALSAFILSWRKCIKHTS